jgi:chromosomal replication initiation ATPase DnaA
MIALGPGSWTTFTLLYLQKIWKLLNDHHAKTSENRWTGSVASHYRARYRALKGLLRVGIEQLTQWVSELTGVPVQAMVGPSKRRQTGKARSLLCFFERRELGMTLTALAHKLGISVPTASVAAQRREQIADREKLEISAS